MPKRFELWFRFRIFFIPQKWSKIDEENTRENPRKLGQASNISVNHFQDFY